MNLTTLRLDTRFLVFGNSSDTSYGNTDLDRNLNIAYRDLVQIAIGYCGEWQLTKTYATTNVLAGVTKYPLPLDILRIDKVEIKPLASLTYPYLSAPIDLREITVSLDEYTPSLPEYDLRKNYIQFFWDQTFEAITNGLKIYYQDDITELSAITDEPKTSIFPKFVHSYLPNRAAHKYCVAMEMWNKAKSLNNDLVDMIIPMIKEHYANRKEDEPVVLRPKELNLY